MFLFHSPPDLEAHFILNNRKYREGQSGFDRSPELKGEKASFQVRLATG